MLTIKENKWDIKYIQILPAQQKVLWKILEKVFISKKYTQCKTSQTLKIDVLEIPDNESIGKLFSKCELLFLDQTNSSSNPSEILILWFPIPWASLPPSPSVKFYPSQLKTLINTIPILFFLGFLILSHPIQPHATTSIEYTRPFDKQRKLNLLLSCMQIQYLMDQTRFPSKSWSFNGTLMQIWKSANIFIFIWM